jgi:hypothetical protein
VVDTIRSLKAPASRRYLVVRTTGRVRLSQFVARAIQRYTREHLLERKENVSQTQAICHPVSCLTETQSGALAPRNLGWREMWAQFLPMSVDRLTDSNPVSLSDVRCCEPAAHAYRLGNSLTTRTPSLAEQPEDISTV